ncbi:hypothetical protein IMG5_107340 [Ichthyophthirius multifiliis]|uniref:Cyclic nucleotide-binding domain-containing protein n=1 Tax=Ichthyophthirius multifiliis TaxID=5932 RepID=G0QTD8_ICHMU|nr:hypothetical protein IMG5_107340 [Ichthyophthirius multifiliis]EGR31515.1 hypothetical protein IMG5_107340 [Ichthyophthirius multifiliis]|eukprot:XP_004035001.1 hypothetical protein IMG5_107340 [Ichthyophthirius multifiliis]
MNSQLQTYLINQTITKQGEKITQFMLILEGYVGLYLNRQNKLYKIKKLYAGDTIETPTLCENGEYQMTTICLSENVKILILSEQNFKNIFQKSEIEKYENELNFIKNIEIFESWPKANLKKLYMCLNNFTVNKSQVIYQQNQPSRAMYIIKKGDFGVMYI